MRSDVSVPSKVVSRLVEIVGAGLASAVGAFLLGQIAKPAAPPPPVVKILPADAATIRMLRGDGSLSADVRAMQGSQSIPYPRLPLVRFEPSAM